jgi:CRISPR-associated protein Cas1
MADDVRQQADRTELMALEAQASRLHWGGVGLMIPFRARRYPRAPDLSNQLLNYGYAVLGRVWLAITLRAGLDPNLGVLHTDRIGRPSLVLDLVEPWRPWVDRVVVGLIRQGTAFASVQGELTLDSRRRLLDGLHRAFSAVPPRRSEPLRALWLKNTRQLARHLHEGAPWQPPLLPL